MSPHSASSGLEAYPLTWWAGALVVLVATAIVAAYVRRRGAGWVGLLFGLLTAVVVGCIMGWRLWGDPWLGGCAGITGACSPWIVGSVQALVGGIVARRTR